MKIIFDEDSDLIKKISTSYHNIQTNLLKIEDKREINKKKYLLNDIVIFHHILN